jgi:hypothetical protein
LHNARGTFCFKPFSLHNSIYQWLRGQEFPGHPVVNKPNSALLNSFAFHR